MTKDNLIVSAKALKIAGMFRAKNDVRHYLNGVCIEKNGSILATEGHIAVECSLEPLGAPLERTIYDIAGSIQAKAYTAEFMPQPGKEKRGIVILKDVMGDTLSALFYEEVDGKFPDFDEMEIFKEEKLEARNIRVNPNYLSIAAKVAKAIGLKYNYVDVKFQSKRNSVILDFGVPETGSVKAVIMEMSR